ncbi:MAG: ATP-binding protein [Victivallales bacterium]|nr:ATP-binding protein [Victivallales bacterium]MBQ6471835.1 ATP-binding protein [Victivallales bacterium]
MKIERREYMERLRGWRAKQVIKVVTGVRRCGKSFLLEMFQEWLQTQGVPAERIVSVNLEDRDNKPLRNPDALHSYIKDRLKPGEMTYVFVDEVQLCEDFPEVIDSIYIRPDVDIYITGSNANLLSHEIATLLSGRYVEIKMLPLSFREFVEMRGDGERSRLYAEYVGKSSFPYAGELLDTPRELEDYLEGLYNTILLKDIAQRRKIPDPLMLDSVTKFVFDSIGSELSTRKIAGALTSDGRKSDSRTIERYLDALLECFLIYKAERYDVKGKQLLKTLEKYYVVDVGLRRHLLSGRSQDVGHILENVVFLELLRRGYKVHIGKVGSLEVDFVAENANGTEYYQVAATVRDHATLERELAPFGKIRDHHPKFLLTLDEDPADNIDGIRKLNALDWLLG